MDSVIGFGPIDLGSNPSRPFISKSFKFNLLLAFMAKKVLILDSVDKICGDILKEGGIEIDSRKSLQDVLTFDYDGLIVRSATKVNASIMNKFAPLEIIGRAGAGIDNIDINEATKKGIAVVNAPYANSISVAELVFSYFLYDARNLGYADSTTKQGEWKKAELIGSELYNKTLGVIGLGNIGKEVAKRAASFGMKILYFDPFVDDARVDSASVNKTSLDNLLKNSDLITIHVSGDNVNGILNSENLSLVKDNAVLVNTARPHVFEKGSLENVLEKKQNLRVALDVHDVEKAGQKPLTGFGDRVILTPHIGASTKEAQERCARVVAEQFVDYFKNHSAQFLVNGFKIKKEFYKYLGLVDKISYLGAAFLNRQPNKIEISCYGKLNEYSDTLSRAAIRGTLRFSTDTFVNYFNAKHVAKDKGIELILRQPDFDKKYGESVTVDLIDSDRISVRGTIDEEGRTVVKRINEYLVNIDLKGNLAFFEYDDSKGALEALGRLAKEKDLNIVNTNQVSSSDRMKAFCFFELDNMPKLDVFDSLEKTGLAVSDKSGNAKTLKVYHAIGISF